MLKFIGNGGAFDKTINSCAYYIFNKHNLVLLDCGENTFQAIKKVIDKNKIANIFVCITHTHADHVNGLSTLCHYAHFIAKCTLTIVCAEDLRENIDTLMKINGNNGQYNINHDIGYDNVVVRFVATKHCPELKSYGILIWFGDTVCYYSGDSCVIPTFIKYLLKFNQIHYYYQDISLHHYEGNVHMSKQVFKKECPVEYKGKIIFYHHKKKFLDKLRELWYN